MVWRPSGPPVGPPQGPCEASFAFKSGSFVWEVLHFLKKQATTGNDGEQVNELTIGSSPRKTHGLAAMRAFSQPLQNTCEARLAFKSGGWAWEVMDFLENAGYDRKQ